MHKGARFYRCDFQVHTPRDQNWVGDRATTDEARTDWAKSLISACRRVGLDAIAITDHHDVAMVKYAQEAAESEADADGQPIAAERRILVFPGMEITLSLPCQLIVLFDADLPLEFLGHLPGALGYVPNPPESERTAPVVKLTQVTHPNEVVRRLEGLSYLAGRFIVLPHVRENGHQTLLRSGFDKHYREFRGVGGYTDGAIPREGTGARTILEGRNGTYGNKPLGVFQTSDCRRGDFATLGEFSTWVKWSRATSEALRQSCLARQSRISQTAPLQPSIAIARVEVSASKFLGKLNLFLSPQYNALIGGRGTGKSTLLEYTRWVLCVPPVVADEDAASLPDYERRSRALIEKTLADVKGAVRIHIDVRGVPHVIERRTASADGELFMKVGSADFRRTDEEEVRRMVPVEAYSQKQLSSIGGTAADILRFVLAPVARDVATLEDGVQTAADKIRSSFARMRATERAAQEAGRLRGQLESLTKQRDAIREQFKGIDPADAAILRSADGYAAERTLRDQWRAEIAEAKRAVEAVALVVANAPSTVPATPQHPDAGELASMRDSLAEFFSSLRERLDESLASFSEAASLALFNEADARLNEALAVAREQFRSARERAHAHEAAIKQAEALASQIADIDLRLTTLDREGAVVGVAHVEFESTSADWAALIRGRSTLTSSRCSVIEQQSHRAIRGTLRPAGDLTGPLAMLADVARGSRVRGDRFDSLAEYLDSTADALTTWLTMLTELRGLIGVRAEDSTLAPAPTLHAAGLSDKDLRAIASKLDDESWLRIRLALPADRVSFEYRARDGEYIPFSHASAGQRATSLMRVLLADEGAPLIVDQPEDDLDNKIIHEIASDIWSAKTRRQLIFASHSANLVVNGNADLVVVFDYGVAGEQTSGVIRAEGAIDDDPVRSAIAEVMEGGQDAFRLRSDKYGF